MKRSFLGVYLSEKFSIVCENINIAFHNFKQISYMYAKILLIPGHYPGVSDLRPLLEPIPSSLL